MANDRRFVIRVLGDASDAMKAFDSLGKGGRGNQQCDSRVLSHWSR